MYAVRPEFGPTLPELLAGHTKAWRNALIGGYVLVLIVVLYLLLLRPEPGSTDVVSKGDVTFSLAYDDALSEGPLTGDERLHLTGTRGREVIVRPLRLPAYAGHPDGFLPLHAERLIPEMRRGLENFEVRREGRAAVNQIPGYDIVFQYVRDGKTRYGRRILLLDSYGRGARDGVDIVLLENQGSVVANSDGIGAAGSLKTLLRSFKFGED